MSHDHNSFPQEPGFKAAPTDEILKVPIPHCSTLQLQQSGLVEKWNKEFWPKPKNCGTSQTHRSLTLEDFSALTVVFFCLIAVAGLVLWAEVLHKRAQLDRAAQRMRTEGDAEDAQERRFRFQQYHSFQLPSIFAVFGLGGKGDKDGDEGQREG